jgi:hypothetical protein
MNRSGEPETLTRVIERNSFNAYGQDREKEETTNRYTMFILGAASFVAGFWAVACLISAMLQNGPLSIIKQLAAAITGK